MTAKEQQFYGFVPGSHYPAPVVELSTALRYASDVLWKMRDHPAVVAENERILGRHTFRKSAQDRPIINFQTQNMFGDEDEESEEFG
jgi:hypothetical protein